MVYELGEACIDCIYDLILTPHIQQGLIQSKLFVLDIKLLKNELCSWAP